MDSWKGRWRGFDFTPMLVATVLAFVVVATVQLSRTLPGGERGLLLFERACPIYSSGAEFRSEGYARSPRTRPLLERKVR